MKIALLTFHTAANFGAALQAYAFGRFLTEKGFDCEYINYVNASRAHEYSMSYHIWDSLRKGQLKSALAYLLGSPFMNLRKYRFNRFYKKHLRKTKQVYRTSKDAESLNDLYDYFIVGSDQVWNPGCNGNDAAFLLDFVKDDSKRMSYSSSFGMTSIDEDLVDIYKRNLTHFKNIAVRETIGQKIVFDLTGKKAELVLDPVLLLTKQQWNDIMPKKKQKEHFIFTYTNRDSQTRDFFSTGYELGSRNHYVLSRYTRPTDFIDPNVRVKYSMSPEEFLYVVNNADLVVSASFHCIAIAIVLNRPFVAIITGNKGKDERILNLLRELQLEDRILKPDMKKEDVERPIDYTKTNQLIDSMKKSSVDYLLRALK